jgi:beta-phosphoglucomutase
VRGLLLDFNGTLSDDEWLLCEIFQELFADAGRPLTREQYYAELVGLSDPEIVQRWLGRVDDELLRRKVTAYRARIGQAETVRSDVASELRAFARDVDVAVVSGAAREEIEVVLARASLRSAVSAIVAAEDVVNGKPDPEGYLRALETLALDAADAVAVEDSPAGVAAARAAGVRCLAVTTTVPRERLDADDHADDLLDAMRRLRSC